MVSKAREDLIKEGLNERAVQKFKDTIQKVNERLEAERSRGEDHSGRIEMQIAENADEIFTVEKLVQCSSSPTEEDAQYLRDIVYSNSIITNFIAHFMNQQSEKRFKFNPT